jgi:hypothetical protein
MKAATRVLLDEWTAELELVAAEEKINRARQRTIDNITENLDTAILAKHDSDVIKNTLILSANSKRDIFLVAITNENM